MPVQVHCGRAEVTGPEPTTQTSVTRLLQAAEQGEAAARERLWSLVYDELRRIAQAQMAAESPASGLQTTILVHEAYLRLVGSEPVGWNSRAHFFAAAANAMRRIRVDDARKRARLKRGGGRHPVGLDHGGSGVRKAGPAAALGRDDDDNALDLLALDEALDRLEALDARKAQVVMLRYFAGLSIDETAAALGIAPRTVDSDWRFARAWLHRALSGES